MGSIPTPLTQAGIRNQESGIREWRKERDQGVGAFPWFLIPALAPMVKRRSFLASNEGFRVRVLVGVL